MFACYELCLGVSRVVARRRERCSSPVSLCSAPRAARDTVSAARKLRPVPVAAPVHSQRPRMPVRVAMSASSTILALAASRWGI